MNDLQDDLGVFYRKIRFQSPVASGAQHLQPHVMTGAERLAIERVVEAARLVTNPMDELWFCKAHGYAIDSFDKLVPMSCLWEGRRGPCEPVPALIVEKPR